MFEYNNNLKSNIRWRGESGAGFTIIELLVVVAIVAVLTGIVMVNVTKYVNKGKDAAIRKNITGILSSSVSWVDANGNYATFSSSPSYTIPADAVKKANGGIDPVFITSDTNDAWCVASPLKQYTPPQFFCVDSTGAQMSGGSVNCCTGGICKNSAYCVDLP